MPLKSITFNIKKTYFDQIRDRTKPAEFRLDNPYWNKRLINQDFDIVFFKLGYPKSTDKEKIVCRKWKGFSKQTITHEFFNNVPTNVFAIDTTGEDIEA